MTNEDLTDARTVFERRDEVQILDVREPHEWEDGHVEGSVHMPLNQLLAQDAELDPAKPVAVVCSMGSRSEVGALMLRARGYDAYNVEGGLIEWQAEGLPLVDDKGEPGRV
ncbi:MAG: rhodanese-like domain-containing protein [Actinobacteria bacterium]|nr:rhodanese-like domain-containing protein [Actinomycetota bacterium]